MPMGNSSTKASFRIPSLTFLMSWLFIFSSLSMTVYLLVPEIPS